MHIPTAEKLQQLRDRLKERLTPSSQVFNVFDRVCCFSYASPEECDSDSYGQNNSIARCNTVVSSPGLYELPDANHEVAEDSETGADSEQRESFIFLNEKPNKPLHTSNSTATTESTHSRASWNSLPTVQTCSTLCSDEEITKDVSRSLSTPRISQVRRWSNVHRDFVDGVPPAIKSVHSESGSEIRVIASIGGGYEV